jgi:hypothetical protein
MVVPRDLGEVKWGDATQRVQSVLYWRHMCPGELRYKDVTIVNNIVCAPEICQEGRS